MLCINKRLYCYDKARTEARKAQSAPDACPKGSLAAGG